MIKICQKKIKDNGGKLTFKIIPKDNEKQDYNDIGNEMKSILNCLVIHSYVTSCHSHDYCLGYTVNEFSILAIKEKLSEGGDQDFPVTLISSRNTNASVVRAPAS